MKRLSILLSMTLLVGCGQFMADQELRAIELLQEVNDSVPQENVSKPTCEVDYADFEIDGKLMYFEIKDKSDLGFGFDLFKGIFKAVGISFKTERGEMIMKMSLQETLRPREVVAEVNGKGTSSGSDFRFELDLLKLGSIDFGYYYQTPIGKLTEKTLADSLKQLQTRLAQVDTGWTSKVVVVPNRRQVIIPAGSVAGVRIGDSFKIYNVESLWRGEPCFSELLFRRKMNPNKPTALAKVVQVELNAALLDVTGLDDDSMIELGALVEIDQLPLAKKEKSRTLARSVRMNRLESGEVHLTNGAKVDLSFYLNEQVTPLLTSYGFYERK